MESFIVPLLLIKFIMNNKEDIKETADNRVFIVEDNEMDSLMMDYLLSQETIAHISKFSSGEECLKHMEMQPDVVILDYGLPGINGVQTLLEIKKLNPDLPVIVITGNKDRHIAQKFLDAGVYDYIEKEDDAFDQVSRVTDSILNIIARKKDKEGHKANVTFALLVSLFVVVACIATYFLLKH
jgi:DNA-binding NtrC family response regulator